MLMEHLPFGAGDPFAEAEVADDDVVVAAERDGLP